MWKSSPRAKRLKKWEVRAHCELCSGCSATHHLRGWLKESPVFHFWDRYLKSFHDSCCSWWFFETVSVGFFFSISLYVFWQECLRSDLYCLEICHRCFVMILICHLYLTTAYMYHLQSKWWPISSDLGKLQSGWVECKLHVLSTLAVSASVKAVAEFSLFCKSCTEVFINWS